MELLDDNQMRIINMVKSTSRSWEEKPTLFIKFAGTKSAVREAIDIVGKIAKRNNGGKFEFARNDKERIELWSARKVRTCLINRNCRKRYLTALHYGKRKDKCGLLMVYL